MNQTDDILHHLSNVPDFGPPLIGDVEDDCFYFGTDFLEMKIYSVGLIGCFIAMVSLLFNVFLSLVFLKKGLENLYYFKILAFLDILLSLNYIALMVVPVLVDYFLILSLYFIFLKYVRLLLMESNCVMMLSCLLIVMATIERCLISIPSLCQRPITNFMKLKRPLISFMCFVVAISYKCITYYEIDLIEKTNCTDWQKYELQASQMSMNPYYAFWFKFLTRNIVDRILPFVILIIMNFLIIRRLKRDQNKAAQTIVHSTNTSWSRASHKKTIKDATIALVWMVTLYIISQSLQIVVTVWETVNKSYLEQNEALYSHLNDLISMFTLLSSTLRLPVYLTCNKPLRIASINTIKSFFPKFFRKIQKEPKYRSHVVVSHMPIQMNDSKSYDSVDLIKAKETAVIEFQESTPSESGVPLMVRKMSKNSIFRHADSDNESSQLFL
uniref:G_PROTEIN_RECEP_F1_2 domain-containing protein n=1 Tax=Rhabditophanes sp. KR3021 TaxID=114890 RepID=A0AC35TK15_9BILA